MANKKEQTRTIEALLKEGTSVPTLARLTGLSRPHIYQIRKRLTIVNNRMEHRDYIRSRYKEHEKALKASRLKSNK